MTEPSINLATRTSWHAVFAALGAELPRGIPGSGRCPYCRKPELFVYQDTSNDGGWYYCKGCKTCGDAVDLAARSWCVPRDQAALRLLPATRSADLSSDLNQLRRRAKTFWLAASSRAVHHPEVLAHMHLSLHLSGSSQADWLERGGRYLGIGSKEQLTQLLSLGRVRRLFPADHTQAPWSDVAVIPFYDLPGRLNALLLLIRDGVGPNAVYLPVGPTRMRTDAPGAMGLDIALVVHSPVLVVMDPLLAVRLHIKHLREQEDHLPLLAVWPEAASLPYFQKFAEHLVFRAETLNADLFRHAWMHRSRVAVHERSRTSDRGQTRREDARYWVEQELHKAQTCAQAVEQAVVRRSGHEVETLMGQLGIPSMELRQLVEQFSPATRAAMKTVTLLQQPRRVVVGYKAVVATTAGWQLEKTGEMVIGCTFRIERIVTDTDKSIHYEGVVNFHGEEIPFAAPETEFTRKPLVWLQQFLLAGGHGVLTWSPTWQRQALNLAMQANPPLAVCVRPTGWNNKEACWVLPDRIVRLGGDVEPLQGQTYNPTTGLVSCDRTTLVAFLYNVLAPAYKYPKANVLLTGPSSPTAFLAFESMQCPLVPWSRLRTNDLNPSWPVLTVEDPTFRQRWLNWLSELGQLSYDLLKGEQPPIVLQADWWLSRLLFLKGGWIRAELNERSAGAGAKPAPQGLGLVTKYLTWLSKRQLRRSGSTTEPLAALTESLSAWLNEDPEQCAVCPELANNGIYTYNSGAVANTFVDIVGRLFVDGYLRLEWLQHQNFPATHPKRPYQLPLPIFYDHDDSTIWIAPAYVNQALRYLDLPVIDIEQLRSDMIAAKRLVGECEHDNRTGFVIEEAWWADRLKASQGCRRTELRLAREA